MTTRELLTQVGQSPALVAAVLLAPSVLAIVLGWLHPRGAGKRSPYQYGYSLAVYLACTFGVMALVIDAYTLLFTRENLLDTNALVTIAPVVAMVTALGLVSRQVKFHELPGFGRLSGLIMMLAASFVGVFILSKTHFAVLFHGSVWTLLMIAAALFAALKLGAHLAFKR